MIKIYGIPNCNQIKKTRTLLEAGKIEYDFINVRQQPVEEEKLREAVRQLGLSRVLNSKGSTYRKLGLDGNRLSEDELFQRLLSEQGMIKRPLIEKDDRFWAGFDENGIIRFVTQKTGK